MSRKSERFSIGPSSINIEIDKLKEQEYIFNANVCPPEITLEMLIEEMKPMTTYTPNVSREFLWNSYYKTVFTVPFGLYFDDKQ